MKPWKKKGDRYTWDVRHGLQRRRFVLERKGDQWVCGEPSVGVMWPQQRQDHFAWATQLVLDDLYMTLSHAECMLNRAREDAGL
jgi:hypothetical protein